jgi:hypothetical protein
MAVWQVQFNDPPIIPYPQSGATAGYQLVLEEPGEADDGDGAVRLFYDQEQVGSVPVYYTTAQSSSIAGRAGR